MELMVSMSLGLIIIGSAVQLFKMGMDSTTVVVQRSEMQENMRAAIELMSKDISLAGAGLPSTGFQLPNGAGSTVSRFGCDQVACHVPGGTYPNSNYMTGIIPGYENGVEGNAVITNASTLINDSVTVVYSDVNFPLNQFQISFPAGGDGSLLNVNVPFPAPVPALPPLNGAGGIQVGDLIWFQNGGSAIGEVTNVTPNTLSFVNNDPLNINQSGAASGNIKALNNGAGAPLVVAKTIERDKMPTAFAREHGGAVHSDFMSYIYGINPVIGE